MKVAAGRRLRIASVSMSFPTIRRQKNGIFVRRRLSALSELADLKVVMPSPWFPPVVQAESPAAIPEFQVTGRPMFYVPRLFKQFDGYWLRRAVLPVIKRWHVQTPLDLIDAHFGYPTGAACLEIGRSLGIPTFITIRGVEVNQLKDPRIGPQLARALSQCAGVIAVSHSLKEAALRAGVGEARIRVVPNAVDTSLFHPGDRIEARSRTGLPAGRPVLVSVGFLTSEKGFHDLMPAFARVLRTNPTALFVVVGGPVAYDRQYTARLQAQIEELGLRDSVRLVGSVPPDEVPHWLRSADAFALATYREGCSNALLEAIACGLPVVVTPAGDNERYVVPGENGFIVPIGDVAALGERLVEVLSANWDRERIARSASQYSWRDVAQAVLDFMRSRIPGGDDGHGR